MDTTNPVYTPARNTAPTETITVRVPASRKRLLEYLQHEDGNTDLSDTVREALYQYLERRMPGSIPEIHPDPEED